MKDYFIGFLIGVLLSALLLWLAVWVQLGVPNPRTQPVENLINYKKQQARQIQGPKMLICAGSSSLLGLRADLITQATGIPTINMGVQAAFGLETSLRWAEELAKPGDSILLAFEYELYEAADLYNLQYVDYIVSYEPGFFRAAAPVSQAKIICNLPNRRVLDGLYQTIQFRLRQHQVDRKSLSVQVNEYGDGINNQNAVRPPNAGLNDLNSVLIHGLSRQPAGFGDLSAFIDWCRSHHITVLATWPNLLYQPEYEGSVATETIARIQEFYLSHGVPIIGEYRESLLPKEQFYDTVYHLYENYAKARTIRLLREWRKRPSSLK